MYVSIFDIYVYEHNYYNCLKLGFYIFLVCEHRFF